MSIKQTFSLLVEHLTWAKPSRVWSVEFPITWVDVEGSDGSPLVEIITFICREWPSGKRDFTIHSYGYCKTFATAEKYAGPFKLWKAGGPEPIAPAAPQPHPKDDPKIVRIW